MNVRLQTLLAEAETQLSEEEKEGLADVIADYLADSGEPFFTPEEIEEIDRLESEPLELADPAEVEALFARYR